MGRPVRVNLPSLKELRKSPAYPPEKVQKAKKTVIIECTEEIPCNPCEEACPVGAISIGRPITNPPRVDFDRCVGCGRCIAPCPGLAIYLLDYHYNEDEAALSFPYEYLPLPAVGEKVRGTNRSGKPICPATVIKVSQNAAADHTTVITIRFPKKFYRQVRGIKLIKEKKNGGVS